MFIIFLLSFCFLGFGGFLLLGGGILFIDDVEFLKFFFIGFLFKYMENVFLDSRFGLGGLMGKFWFFFFMFFCIGFLRLFIFFVIIFLILFKRDEVFGRFFFKKFIGFFELFCIIFFVELFFFIVESIGFLFCFILF